MSGDSSRPQKTVHEWEIMPGQHHRRKKGRHRGASAKANADLMSHVVSLGLEGVEQYRNWCREHCVGSYANNCQRGKPSFWSMQVEDTEGVSLRVMTIALKNRNISQARGKYNALPSEKIRSGKQRTMAKLYREYLKQSRRILHLWVEQEGLLMPRHV